MIRTTKQVLIDAQRDISDVVYMQINPDTIVLGKDIVTVDIELFTFKNGQFNLFSRQQVRYKRQNWNAFFGAVSVENYDTIFIQQIAFVNDRTLNNGWNETEATRIAYWPHDITLNDLEIVTPAMLGA